MVMVMMMMIMLLEGWSCDFFSFSEGLFDLVRLCIEIMACHLISQLLSATHPLYIQ